MIVIIITIAALVGYLALSEKYVKLREICRITYFAALLALLLQYGAYFNSVIKEAIR